MMPQGSYFPPSQDSIMDFLKPIRGSPRKQGSLSMFDSAY